MLGCEPDNGKTTTMFLSVLHVDNRFGLQCIMLTVHHVYSTISYSALCRQYYKI